MTYVKWPTLLVWHTESAQKYPDGRGVTACGLLVGPEVLRTERRPRRPARVCRLCESGAKVRKGRAA